MVDRDKFSADMTPNEVAGAHVKIYEAWYNQVDKNHTNVIGALDAAKFLKKSGLPDNVLGQIWDIADSKCMGQLDKTGFFIALKMIALAQNSQRVDISNARLGVPPPNMGEPPPLASTPPAMGNGDSTWAVKPQDKQRYDQIFNSLGPVGDRLPGNKVKEVLMNSKLPLDTLGRIWDLSDIDKDGFLDRDEFTIAMHLVYRALAKHAVPAVLPPELVPAGKARGATLGTMPDLLPTSDGLIKPVARPVVPPVQQQWVVSAADKARADVMFRAADKDQDGFVSGVEIRDTFLQSGVPQLALAHIWNLCDMKLTGKLNREQFALALHLIQQKLQGAELPAALTPEMVPPTMRPKPGQEQPPPPPQETGPTYDNPELETMHKEIQALVAEQNQLELEIGQREDQVKNKTAEASTLQCELDTLTATLKQLEGQKSAASGKLDDLAAQTSSLERDLEAAKQEVAREQQKVERLQNQVKEQEESLVAQEQELSEKRQELTQMRDEELRLESEVKETADRQERLGRALEDAVLQISQAKTKAAQLEECQRRMSEALEQCEAAVVSGDASSLPESALEPVDQSFADPQFTEIRSMLSPEPEPEPEQKPEPEPEHRSQPPPRPAAPTFHANGFNDPFRPASGGGGAASSPAWGASDPFGAWDSAASAAAPAAEPAAGSAADPFGAEPFAAPAATPVRPAPVTPDLPPKAAKVPPPRPAPPKNVPARPPPPTFAAKQEPPAASTGFADFAKFDQ